MGMYRIGEILLLVITTIYYCNAQCSNTSQACILDGNQSAQCNNTRTNNTCPLLYPASIAIFDAYDGKIYTVGQSILIVALFPDALCGLPQPRDISSNCTPTMKLRLNLASGEKCFDVVAASSVYQAELDYGVSFLDDYTLNTKSGPYNHWVFPLHVSSGMNSPRLEFLELRIPPACNVTDKYNFANWTRLDTRLPLPSISCNCSNCSNCTAAALLNSSLLSATMNATLINATFSIALNISRNGTSNSTSNVTSNATKNGTTEHGCNCGCGCGCGCWCCGGCGCLAATAPSSSSVSNSTNSSNTTGRATNVTQNSTAASSTCTSSCGCTSGCATSCGCGASGNMNCNAAAAPTPNVTVNCNCTPPPPPPPPPPPRDNNTLTPFVLVDTHAPAIINLYTGKPAGSYTAGDLITIIAELSRPVAFSELPSRSSQVRNPPAHSSPAL